MDNPGTDITASRAAYKLPDGNFQWISVNRNVIFFNSREIRREFIGPKLVKFSTHFKKKNWAESYYNKAP